VVGQANISLCRERKSNISKLKVKQNKVRTEWSGWRTEKIKEMMRKN
jgi:hypothetical protein